MSGIWRSPELKPKVATQSPRKTTTSTPNIISGRCRPREQNSRDLMVGRWNARRRHASLTLSKMGIPLALRGRLLTQPYHANARCGRLSPAHNALDLISIPKQIPLTADGRLHAVRSCLRYRPNAERRPCLSDLECRLSSSQLIPSRGKRSDRGRASSLVGLILRQAKLFYPPRCPFPGPSSSKRWEPVRSSEMQAHGWRQLLPPERSQWADCSAPCSRGQLALSSCPVKAHFAQMPCPLLRIALQRSVAIVFSFSCPVSGINIG